MNILVFLFTVINSETQIQIGKKYEIYVSGGGNRNPFMMKYIKESLPHYKVKTSELLKIGPDAKEAIEFALLWYLTWNKLPDNLPSAIGNGDFTILGKIEFNYLHK